MPAVPHVFKRKAVAVPLVTVLVAVAAFEGYGLYTRSRPVEYSRGGDFAAAATPSVQPSTAPVGTPGQTTTPGASASTLPSASPHALPRTDGTTAPVVSGSGPEPVSPPSRAAHVVVPRTGSYELAVTGSEKVQFGPVSFCNQTLPSSTHLVVSKAAGESATSYDFDVPYFPGQTGQHDERHIYRFTPKAVFLDYEIATVTCQGVRQSSATSFAPPQLRAELPLVVGARWHNHGGGSSRTEDSDSTVTRTETLTVAGQHVLTYVIDMTTSFTGDETGTRHQTWWYAPTWAMPVKWTEKQSGSRSGASYSGDLAVLVLSRP